MASVELFTGVSALLEEINGPRFCGDSVNDMIGHLDAIEEAHKSAKPSERERDTGSRLSSIEPLLERALDLAPEGELKDLLEEAACVLDRMRERLVDDQLEKTDG
jgi:hypothetical protein